MSSFLRFFSTKMQTLQKTSREWRSDFSVYLFLFCLVFLSVGFAGSMIAGGWDQKSEEKQALRPVSRQVLQQADPIITGSLQNVPARRHDVALGFPKPLKIGAGPLEPLPFYSLSFGGAGKQKVWVSGFGKRWEAKVGGVIPKAGRVLAITEEAGKTVVIASEGLIIGQ